MSAPAHPPSHPHNRPLIHGLMAELNSADDLIAAAHQIHDAGYRCVDLTGSSIFEVMVRFREENPWKGLDAIRAAFPTATLRAGARTNGIVGMNVTPDSIAPSTVSRSDDSPSS